MNNIKRLFAAAIVLAAIPASSASADSYLCNSQNSPSFSVCTDAHYTAHGYENHYMDDVYADGVGYWRAINGRNCTNYVGYMLTQNGEPGPGVPMGNGGQWDNTILNNPSWGYTVNDTPAVGAIAQWEGEPGHVAYVESVETNSIIISEDNSPSGPFRWKIITTTGNWPDNFLHIKDQSSASYHYIPLAYQQGNNGGIALFDQNNGTFYFKNGPNYSTNQTSYTWAAGTNYQPIVGDFNNDDYVDIGLRNSSNGTFYFKYGPNYASNQTTYAWAAGTNYQAIAGDFNGDGRTDIGLRNSSNGAFYIKNGPNYANNQTSYTWAAGTNYVALAGSFGGGVDGIALFDKNSGTFYFKNGPNYSSNQSSYDWAHGPNYQPFIGDINGDGHADIGLRNANTGTLYFKHGSNYSTNQSTYQWVAG